MALPMNSPKVWIADEAQSIRELVDRIRNRFTLAKADATGLKPHLLQVANEILGNKPFNDIAEYHRHLLLNCTNFTLETHDYALLGQVLKDEEAYIRLQVNLWLRSIIYFEFRGKKEEDQGRIVQARQLATQI